MFTFPMGSCQVQVRFSCLALLAFCCIFTGGLGCGGCFGAVCLHELAHLTVMGLFCALPSKVELSALGCRVILGPGYSLPDRRQCLISLAGPAMNWVCFLAAVWLGYGGGALARASLALAFIHSLPIEPLDGGLALRYLLRGRFGGERAERISRVTSTLFLVPLAAMGFLMLLQTRYNYSLLALSVYLMLYLVLKWDYTQP